MRIAACGVTCDVCALYIKGICRGCTAGTDEEGAREKLNGQTQAIKMRCPILVCAVDKKVSYCLKDCKEFPCAKFESGWEAIQGPGPFPYSTSFLKMFKRRLDKE